jgi:hypothetical protein
MRVRDVTAALHAWCHADSSTHRALDALDRIETRRCSHFAIITRA